jgi:hypothetical protein
MLAEALPPVDAELAENCRFPFAQTDLNPRLEAIEGAEFNWR